MSDLSYARDSYARAVFDGQLETKRGDFDPQAARTEAVLSALKMNSAASAVRPCRLICTFHLMRKSV
jgi:hypothetical protein